MLSSMKKSKSKKITYEFVSPESRIPKKIDYYLDRDNLLEELKEPCLCKTKRNCTDHYSFAQIMASREHYHSKTEVEKMNWLISLLTNYYDREENTIRLLAFGKSVCRIGFLIVHGITLYKYYAAINHIKDGLTIFVHGNNERDYYNNLSSLCFSFLEDYQLRYAETQPDMEEYHLPCHCLKYDIYFAFKEKLLLTTNDKHIPMYNTFLTVWRNDFPKLLIPKKNRLGTCDICVELANNSKSLSIDTHGLWSQQRRDHLRLVRLERDENTRRIVNSRAYPNLVTVIGIDRMNAIKLPWQVPFSKS